MLMLLIVFAPCCSETWQSQVWRWNAYFGTGDCFVWGNHTATIAMLEMAELVAISCHDTFCLLLSSTIFYWHHITHLFRYLPVLYHLLICEDFNVHESSWLYSTHTSSGCTAMFDFCESWNLHQLIDFPTRCDAILDLILSEHPGFVKELPNLNASDHVAVLLRLESLTIPTMCYSTRLSCFLLVSCHVE